MSIIKTAPPNPPAKIPNGCLRGAELYATRDDMVAAIGPARIDRIAEIGVALGYFTSVLTRRYKPKTFYAVDMFQLHEVKTIWGTPSEQVFNGATHRQHYETLTRGLDTKINVLEGQSFEQMRAIKDKSLGLIYVDASHHYPDVKADAEACIPKLASDGIIIFNDYILWSHGSNEMFGVVHVVNDLLASGEWKVIGFALHPDMYCDIALVHA